MICGVDEAGRGPLAGNVVAAAVILDPRNPISGLNDSKKLSAKKRDALEIEIKEKALYWCVAEASPREIDQLNILWASMLAMKRAIEGLAVAPSKALIDGNRNPDVTIPCEAIIGGDGKEECIGAASILAKVERDRQLVALDAKHPQYGFAKHKGYPTKAHRDALMESGPIDEHRRSFGPVQAAIDLFSA
jgi:ribonuclease HII